MTRESPDASSLTNKLERIPGARADLASSSASSAGWPFLIALFARLTSHYGDNRAALILSTYLRLSCFTKRTTFALGHTDHGDEDRGARSRARVSDGRWLTKRWRKRNQVSWLVGRPGTTFS